MADLGVTDINDIFRALAGNVARLMLTESWLGRWSHYFEPIVCDTPELLREAQSLVYNVYALELHWDEPADYVDGRLVDPWDKRAISMMTGHRPTGQLSSHVRVVLPDPNDQTFSFQKYCPEEAIRQVEAKLGKTIFNTGEVSSACVPGRFRRRCREYLYPIGDVHQLSSKAEERRSFSSISEGVYLQAIAVCLEHELSGAVCVLNRAHARLIKSKIPLIELELILPFECEGPSNIYWLGVEKLLTHRRSSVEDTFNSLAKILTR